MIEFGSGVRRDYLQGAISVYSIKIAPGGVVLFYLTHTHISLFPL
jgi:hypothetical protein